MLISQIGEALHPCLEATIEYLIDRRRDSVPDLVSSGLNFSIILGSACYLEGVLEAVLRTLVRLQSEELTKLSPPDVEARKALSLFDERLRNDLSRRIGRTTGAAGYDEMFQLLTGKRLCTLVDVSPYWEGITVLFNFRNVLGHGREVWGLRETSYDTGIREEFPGYAEVERYLIKNKLLDRRFLDAPSDYMFLSDLIADHFWKLARSLPARILMSLNSAQHEVLQAAFNGKVSFR